MDNNTLTRMSGDELLAITDKQFADLNSPTRCDVLRALDNFASNCTGKTMPQADAKRRPFLKREAELRLIHEQLWKDFWEEQIQKGCPA
jgi:hypothetical protein